jgi:hypothetical protein
LRGYIQNAPEHKHRANIFGATMAPQTNPSRGRDSPGHKNIQDTFLQAADFFLRCIMRRYS